ncbi:rhomboid family intramembrane serine protease [Flavitalea antarctica]
MDNRFKRKMTLGQDGNTLVLLLAILATVFCLFIFLRVGFYLSGIPLAQYYENIFSWFSLPADLGTLARRPWTLITYMFMHDGVWHMLGNVIWIWIFGYILQDLSGNGKIIPLFLYGGVAGGLLFLLSYNIFPGLRVNMPIATVVGASAGAMAIAIATTVLAPGYRIFPMINGGIPLWVITLIYIIVDVAMISSDNSGGHIAHIGGAIIGYIFTVQLKKGNDWSSPVNKFFYWISNLFNPDKKNWKKTAKRDFHYSVKGTEPYKKIPNITQKRIDDILDKINQQGYRYLTEEEKDILKRAADDDA